MRARISDAVARFVYEHEREALEILFDFRHPDVDLGARQDAAAAVLGVTGGGNSFRRGRQRTLLASLADEMYRGELSWLMSQLSTSSTGCALDGWSRLLHFERSVEIDDQDARVQHWYTRFVLRATRPSQALFVSAQQWSGGGTGPRSREPGEIEILSGASCVDAKEAGSGVSEHKLLAVRPEFPGNQAFNVYIWDLGSLATVGQEIELRYVQHLVDEAGTFRPYIGMATATHDEIATIKLRAKVPEHIRAKATGIQYEVNQGNYGGSRTASYMAAPVGVRDRQEITARDDDGFFTYKPTPLHPGDYYLLEWREDL